MNYKDKIHIIFIFAKSFEDNTIKHETVSGTPTYYISLEDMADIIKNNLLSD